MNQRLEKSLVGACGVFHVSAELSHRGWVAMPTIRNTKGIDIMAEKDGKSVNIQVKTNSYGKASTDRISNMWAAARKRLAANFCNPRLLKIHYHILRHWKLTSYAHAVKDPFMVQIFARHKDMKSTGRYIHYEKIIYRESKQNEWTVRAAKTMDEASELMQVGFEYTNVEYDGFKLFRKRK